MSLASVAPSAKDVVKGWYDEQVVIPDDTRYILEHYSGVSSDAMTEHVDRVVGSDISSSTHKV